MRKLYFAAVFDLYVFEPHKFLFKQVHHPYSLIKPNDHVEARWMERDTIGLFFKQLVNFEIESVLSCV